MGLLAIAVAAVPRWQAFATATSDWLDYPFMRDGSSEGLIQHETGLIQQGGALAIYSPVTPERFTSAPYPPLFYWLNAAVSPKPAALAARAARIVADVQAKNVAPPTDSPFGAGRRISLIAALAAALFIALLVYVSSQNRLFGLIGGLIGGGLWLTLPAVSVWATRVRADMLMTALQMAALVVIARWPRRWPVIFFGGAPLLALALFTKQTALAAPLAVFLFLVWQGYGARQKGWRPYAPVLALLGGLALWVGVPFLIMDILSGNELLLRLVVYHALPWQGRNFGTYFDLFWHENLGLLIVGLLAGIGFFTTEAQKYREDKRRGDKHGNAEGRRPDGGGKGKREGGAERRTAIAGRMGGKLPPIALFSALPLLYGLGVAGADHNHLLPLEAMACAGAGWAVAWLAAVAQVRRVLLALPVVALGLLLAQAAIFSQPQPLYSVALRVPNAKVQSQYTQILANAAVQPGPILSSEAGWSVLAGKDTPYNDLFTLNALADKGTYSREGFLTSIRNGVYSVILTESDLKQRNRSDVWPPEVGSAITERYVLRFRDAWFTYAPK